MDFESKTGQGGDWEKAKPGTYTGVVIGFADIGTQDGGKFGPRHQVMLRWELHKRSGPSLDSKGNVATITERYTASADKKATLRAVAEAHLGPLPDGSKWGSRNLIGQSARLTLVESEDKKYVNVKTVAPLDPEEDKAVQPTGLTEHWELKDPDEPPVWAKWYVEKSNEWQTKNGYKGLGGAGTRWRKRRRHLVLTSLMIRDLTRN